ncbi:MAG: pyruvate dehydrogenase (acetyl-transferring) E1 component subunit alpha [archaeon]
MPKRVAKSFKIERLEILDTDGVCDEAIMPKLNEEDIRRMYELMVLTRLFDEKAFNLQRQGRLGTFARSLGQEASQIGSAYALRKEDWMFPSFREHGAYITRGMPLRMLFQYWAGDERGDMIPEGLNCFTVAIPVGTQIPHAVGLAWAASLRGDRIAAAVYFGDGATSKGDFHEALNFAGVFKVPVIFLCQNNHYAISVPVERQTAAETLAQKAVAYGFEGIQVDGNDVFAVFKATSEALEKARSGLGPTLIECDTYRISDHTTSDDASRYRTSNEVLEWRKKDPVDRLRKYMQRNQFWNEEYERKLLDDLSRMVEKGVQEAEAAVPPKPEDIFSFTFAETPRSLKEQMEDLLGNPQTGPS